MKAEMIKAIVNDLEAFAERDAQGFWDHIRHTERNYLKRMGDRELAELYKDVYEDTVLRIG